MPSNVRVELSKAGFDWEKGVIIAEQPRAKQSLHVPAPVDVLKHDSEVLDRNFCNGHLNTDMPRVFARDEEAVYLPYAGKHGIRILRVAIHPKQYLKNKEVIPYPGED